jgi:retinal pigment epithelial membrane protein
MSTRVFDIFRRHRQRAGCPPQRLIPEADYVQRLQETTHTVRFFRLDYDLRLESAYVFAPGSFMAAPVFVPRPDATGVRDGWLVGQVWGPEQPHMELWIWDAARPLDYGPICKPGPAPGERGLQPGFPLHSVWIDRAGLEHWCQTDYRMPLMELPTYLKVCELSKMILGMLRALLRQTCGHA